MGWECEAGRLPRRGCSGDAGPILLLCLVFLFIAFISLSLFSRLLRPAGQQRRCTNRQNRLLRMRFLFGFCFLFSFASLLVLMFPVIGLRSLLVVKGFL